jgi:hypothetical protein
MDWLIWRTGDATSDNLRYLAALTVSSFLGPKTQYRVVRAVGHHIWQATDPRPTTRPQEFR